MKNTLFSINILNMFYCWSNSEGKKNIFTNELSDSHNKEILT